MKNGISVRDLTILIRAVGVVIMVFCLLRVYEAWTLWEQIAQAKSMRSVGMVTSKEVTDAIIRFAEAAWPPTAGVLLLLFAGIVSRLIMLGLPGLDACATCAYDLTGVKSGKCPECGEKFGARPGEGRTGGQ